MLTQLVVRCIVIAFDCDLLDRPAPSLDLTIGPRVTNFGQPMFDPVFLASHVEHMGHVGGGWPVLVARREGELDAITPWECR